MKTDIIILGLLGVLALGIAFVPAPPREVWWILAMILCLRLVLIPWMPL